MGDNSTNRTRNTQLVTNGRDKRWTGGLVNTPVMRASTILFDSYKDLREGVNRAYDTESMFYGRMGTPSQWSLRQALADLEGAKDALLYPSGIAAISATLLSLARSGDHILLPDNIYEPVRGFARQILARMQIDVTYYDPMAGAGISELMTDKTRIIFVETPGSLTFEVPDLPAIIEAAKKTDAYVIVDNTWATPLYYNPLELGADISIIACTKYIVGHSDVMMGAACANDRTWKKLEKNSFLLGQTVSADDAYLTLRGLRTLSVRLKQHEMAALEIAKWLETRPEVAKVLHPALPNSAGHDIWARDFSGSTGLFSIILNGGTEPDCAPMVDHMQLFKMGFSWGGFESLILPANPTQIRTATKWEADGPLLRIHIGLEDIEELKQDLAAGLERYQTALSEK